MKYLFIFLILTLFLVFSGCITNMTNPTQTLEKNNVQYNPTNIDNNSQKDTIVLDSNSNNNQLIDSEPQVGFYKLTVYIYNLNTTCENDNLVVLKDRQGNIIASSIAKEKVDDHQIAYLDINSNMPEFIISTYDDKYIQDGVNTTIYKKLNKYNDQYQIDTSNGGVYNGNPIFLRLSENYPNECKPLTNTNTQNVNYNTNATNNTQQILSTFLYVKYFDLDNNPLLITLNDPLGRLYLKNANTNNIVLNSSISSGVASFSLPSNLGKVYFKHPDEIYSGPDYIEFKLKNGKKVLDVWENGGVTEQQESNGSFTLNYKLDVQKMFGYISVRLYDSGKKIDINNQIFDLYLYDDITDDYTIPVSGNYPPELKNGELYFKINTFGKFKIKPINDSKYYCDYVSDYIIESKVSPLGKLKLYVYDKDKTYEYNKDINNYYRYFGCSLR